MNPEIQNDVGNGTPFPQFSAITAQRPRIPLTTRALAVALGLTGSTGVKVDGTNNLAAFFALLGDDGLPASGSVHRTYTTNRGLLVPRRLQCNHRQSATLDLEALLFSSDGIVHPIVIADNVALPTLPQDNEHHTLGAVLIGYTADDPVPAMGCIQSLTIDFGQGADTLGCSSDLYDRHVQQPGIRPVITITGLAAAIFGSANIPPVGKAFDHAETAIYLRKRSEDGIGFVASATEEHIKLTANGVGVVTQHTGQGTNRAEVTVQLTCSWDGTNAPIVIDTTAALP